MFLLYAGWTNQYSSYMLVLFSFSLQNQSIMAIETELDGYKRQVHKVQEQNEQLTYMHNRIESDISTVKKQIIICQNKHEALRIEYSTYSRTLHETEITLNRAQTVCFVLVSVYIYIQYTPSMLQQLSGDHQNRSHLVGVPVNRSSR